MSFVYRKPIKLIEMTRETALVAPSNISQSGSPCIHRERERPQPMTVQRFAGVSGLRPVRFERGGLEQGVKNWGEERLTSLD